MDKCVKCMHFAVCKYVEKMAEATDATTKLKFEDPISVYARCNIYRESKPTPRL